MIINHNISAIYSHRTLKFHDMDESKDIEKLSSGMRINRAGDDAAGLAVSEKMRTQILGLRQAERNAEDGISFVQTTEGFLSETQNMIQRIRVLAVQSANGIYSDEDRQQIQVEVSQLIDEIDRIASQAEFNKMKMLTGAFARLNPTASMWFHIGPNMHQRERVFINTMTTQALGLRNPTVLTFISISTPDKANSVIVRCIVMRRILETYAEGRIGDNGVNFAQRWQNVQAITLDQRYVGHGCPHSPSLGRTIASPASAPMMPSTSWPCVRP
jgi:flagellin